MKTLSQTLFFLLLVPQICFAQLYQQTREANPNIKDSLLDRQDKHFPIIGRNIQARTSHEFSTSNFPDKLKIGNDTFDVNSISYPFLNDRFHPNELKKNSPLTDRVMIPKSQVYVIDTAIVRRLGYGAEDPGDTTRHLYSFNADAQRTSDLMQKLTGNIWVDTLRQSNTYDANANMLSDLEEYWANGQWVNFHRSTYTYDANGKR